MKVAPLILYVALIPTDATAQILELAELNTQQITSLHRAKTVVVIPGGILEEHGPYLPSFTDGYNNVSLARRLAEAVVARPGWTAVMFPVIPLGAGGANEIGKKTSFPAPMRSAPTRCARFSWISRLSSASRDSDGFFPAWPRRAQAHGRSRPGR